MNEVEKKKSFNPAGRPKGSKNKITLAKLAAEEAFLTRNKEKIDAFLDYVVEKALRGDKAYGKMLFDALVTKGVHQAAGQAKEQVRININAPTPELEVQGDTIDHEEIEDGQV